MTRPTSRRRCPARTRWRSSSAIAASCRRPTRAAIRSSWRAAKGPSVEDVDGNRFLDCAAGIAVNATGHSHPEVVKAIVDQAQRFLHMSGTDFYYEPQVRLAEEMAAIAPMDGGGAVVLRQLGHRGDRGVRSSCALRDTKRHNIIAFLGAFHGRTMGALSLTASKAMQRRGFGPMVPGVYHAPYANCYRCPVDLRPDTCAASAWTSSRSRFWCTSSRPTKWPQSSSSRSRERVATSCRRR